MCIFLTQKYTFFTKNVIFVAFFIFRRKSKPEYTHIKKCSQNIPGMKETKARAPTRCGYFIKLRTLSNKNEENKIEEKYLKDKISARLCGCSHFFNFENLLIKGRSNHYSRPDNTNTTIIKSLILQYISLTITNIYFKWPFYSFQAAILPIMYAHYTIYRRPFYPYFKK